MRNNKWIIKFDKFIIKHKYKMYLYVKGPQEAKYQFLIKKNRNYRIKAF